MTVVRAVAGLLFQADLLLSCERPLGKPYAGYWEFPGGKIEKDESSLDALKRELYEELGIRVESATFLFEHYHRYPDKEVLIDFWRILAYQGELIGKENQKLAWLNSREIEKLPLLEGNRAVMSKILSNLGRFK